MDVFDIVIIGGGPAGLTAALYALRAEKTVLVLEKMGLGGQIALSEGIENFPGIPKISGMEFAFNLASQVESLGGKIEYETALEIRDGKEKTVVTDLGEYTARAVIIATGVKNRLLGAKNEDKLVGRGVSFCAVCDGAFYRGKDVAVIGGGNTAVQDAIYLSGVANKVYLIHRRDKFRAESRLVRTLGEKENVELVLDSVVEEFLMDENDLGGIEVRNLKTQGVSHLEIQGAFVAVGKIPQNELFEGIVPLDEGGFADVSENCHTAVEGIFVAGDCRGKRVRQLTTAVSDGSIAALAACEYLE